MQTFRKRRAGLSATAGLSCFYTLDELPVEPAEFCYPCMQNFAQKWHPNIAKLSIRVRVRNLGCYLCNLCRIHKIDQILQKEFNDLALKMLALPVCLVPKWHLSAYLLMHVHHYSRKLFFL